jgi:hypothetical protein
MKRLYTTLILLAFTLCGMAQYQKGDTFIYPRIGFAISNHTNNSLYYATDSKPVDSRPKAGFTAGVEGERFLSNPLSLSVGLFYANQGFKYPDFGTEDTEAKTFWNAEKQKTTMHYLQIPIMANLYVADGLAIKAGVEMGYLLQAKTNGRMTEGIIDSENMFVVQKTEEISQKCTDAYRNIDFSIPIGASYEYMGFVLDLRYHFGLTNISKHLDKTRNSVLTFTLGYQFEI